MSLNYQSGPWDELNPRGDEKVSDFLQNLHSVLKNPEFLDVLSWNEGGDAFVVKDLPRMRNDVLPLYYNHNDLESFNKELINLGFQQVNIQNNQTLYFHLKFKMDAGTFTSHLASKEEKMTKINLEVPNVEDSTPRAGSGDAGILDTTKSQIGNNELYWEFIKMKLRISEIDDSNSKLLKKVDELSARVENLQSELVSERQRNDQLMNHRASLNEQIYLSEPKNTENNTSTSQLNKEDFEKTIANLEKALNLTGNIQLLQENIANASAANDKRLILSNIERLRDFLKAKRSLDVLSQNKKKKKKKIDKEKRLEFGNEGNLDHRLIDQIRKMPKSEALNMAVFNQLAKNFPQATAAANSRLQGLGEQFSPFKMEELALRPYSANQLSHTAASTQMDPSSTYYLSMTAVQNGGQNVAANQCPNGGYPANYMHHSASPPLRYATNHSLTQQHGPDTVTIHSRVEQYQTNCGENISAQRLDGAFENNKQHMDQILHPFLQNQQEITLSMSRNASKDQHQEPLSTGPFFHTQDSHEDNNSHLATNFLSQAHFGLGLTDSITPEGPSANYSNSVEFASHLQKPVLPDDNFQIPAPHGGVSIHSSMSTTESYMDNLGRVPLCHQQIPACDGTELQNQFYFPESNNSRANNYSMQPMNGFNGQTQAMETGADNREIRVEYNHHHNDSQQETVFNQYSGYSNTQIPHSNELNQLLQNQIHNYSL
jgi:cell division protein FtsB